MSSQYHQVNSELNQQHALELYLMLEVEWMEQNLNQLGCRSVIGRAGNSRSCTRFCVEYACSMRKVQGSNPGGCLMTFYDLLFFHNF